MIQKENVIKVKTYQFALKIVMLFKDLQSSKEFVLSKQLLRSATSVGANAEEGSQAQTKADFIHKFSICQKEIFETHYWLRLLRDSNYLENERAIELIKDCEEIQKIITAILITAKRK